MHLKVFCLCLDSPVSSVQNNRLRWCYRNCFKITDRIWYERILHFNWFFSPFQWKAELEKPCIKLTLCVRLTGIWQRKNKIRYKYYSTYLNLCVKFRLLFYFLVPVACFYETNLIFSTYSAYVLMCDYFSNQFSRFR